MALTQKCLYALRALLELARRHEQGPARINEIARAQGIPTRFLEVILNELRQGGFADSRRGKEGGYTLARDPSAIGLGEVIRFVEGSLAPVEQRTDDPVFQPVWDSAEAALSAVYDGVTLADLLRRQEEADRSVPLDFMI